MMACDAMKENGLSLRVGHEIGRHGHLLQRRARSAHRYDDPLDARSAHHSRLADILGIVAIDRRERDNRPDPLSSNDPAQGPGALPGPSQKPPGDYRDDVLLDHLVPEQRRALAQDRRPGPSQGQPDRSATSQPHSRPSFQRAMAGSIVPWAIAPVRDRAATGGEGTELIKYSCSAQERNRREVCGQWWSSSQS